MNNITNITIPTPCHQSWQQMTPAGQGRHCQSCDKIVTDFTAMSNSQIINYLSTAGNVCGRFNKPQLTGINYGLEIDSSTSKWSWKKMALAFTIFSSGFSCKSIAQGTPVLTVQQPAAIKNGFEKPLLGKVRLIDSTQTRLITGRVLDETNLPMPGVTVKALTGNAATITDANGNFKINVMQNAKQLGISFIGYKPLQIDVCADKDYQVKLNEDQQALMGDIIVFRKPTLIKRIYYKCIKRPIRKIFN
jgi:CarboxypepD_reg-like domain